MRIAFGVVLAACMVAAASGQVVSLEHFCDEPRRVLLTEDDDHRAREGLRSEKGAIERALKQVKSAPQTETAIASRMARLKVDLLAAERIDAAPWDDFDGKLVPIVHRWAIAAGDTKTTDRYIDVFNILQEIKVVKDEYFNATRKAFKENQKPLPPEPWSEEQIRALAKNKADEKIGIWKSSTCEIVYDKLDDSSGLRPFVLPANTDDLALLRSLRGSRDKEEAHLVLKAKLAMELGELSEEKLTARLAKVNEQLAAMPKQTSFNQRLTPPREEGELRREFAAAFGAMKDLVREKGTMADGSEVKCERTEGKIAERFYYLLHHAGRSYLATVRCACDGSNGYLPNGPLVVKPVAGTKAVLAVKEDFQRILIMTPSVVIEMTPAPGSPLYTPPPIRLSDEDRATPAGKSLEKWLNSQDVKKEPEPLTPQVIEDVVAAVFELGRM